MLVSGSASSSEYRIPYEFYEIAKKKKVPPKILYAIALQESKTLTNKGRIIPWKYTVNYRGKGYFYRSKEEMRADLKRLIDLGIYNFDVGIAQINYKWHKGNLKSLDDFIDPYSNLSYAASYLRKHFEKHNDWWVATGAYHSPRNQLAAEKYRKGVYRLWSKL